MARNAPRLVTAVALLVAVWIVAYWLWPAGSATQDPGITFDDASGPPRLSGAPPARDAYAPLVRAAEPRTQPAPQPPAPQPSSEPQSGPALPKPAPDGPPAGKPAVLIPRFTEYTVREGDTIVRIAKRLYGKDEHWQSIAKANPRVDPQKLRAGQTLKVPVDPANIQGVLVNPPPHAAPPTASPEPPRGAAIEYVVRPGDTLGEIARSFYGKSSLWQAIVDANRDQISSPEQIRPGMKLRIPPVGAAAEADSER
jgi:nucleoid-associated protein YgaU